MKEGRGWERKWTQGRGNTRERGGMVGGRDTRGVGKCRKCKGRWKEGMDWEGEWMQDKGSMLDLRKGSEGRKRF